jgi:hypothetical protein
LKSEDKFQEILNQISQTPDDVLVKTVEGRKLLSEAIRLAPESVQNDIKAKFHQDFPNGGKGTFAASERGAILGVNLVKGGGGYETR